MIVPLFVVALVVFIYILAKAPREDIPPIEELMAKAKPSAPTAYQAKWARRRRNPNSK